MDERLLEASPGTEVEHLVCLQAGVHDTVALADLEATPAGEFDLQESWRALDGQDVLTLINAVGKNMSPTNIEMQLKSAHPLIEQGDVVGTAVADAHRLPDQGVG